MQQLPDGYIVKTENPDDSFLVYGELSGRGFVSKGYRLEIPNLGNANNGLKNDLFSGCPAGWRRKPSTREFRSAIPAMRITGIFWLLIRRIRLERRPLRGAGISGMKLPKKSTVKSLRVFYAGNMSIYISVENSVCS